MLKDGIYESLYLGIKNYWEKTAEEVQEEGACIYEFVIDGTSFMLPIRKDSDFSIQNTLMRGYPFRIEVKSGVVVGAQFTGENTVVVPRIKGIPGLRTLKNFITTAFSPMGTVLYVFGGNWNWQDNGASQISRRIGIPGTWADFYNRMDAHYEFKTPKRPEEGTFPVGGFNEFYFAGTDCSGFVGWTLYNTLYTKNGEPSFFASANRITRYLAENRHLGHWKHDDIDTEDDPLRPGDIVGTLTHVWICLGKCSDGSIMLIHSTVGKSTTEATGGGVQLSAIDPKDRGEACEAYVLADAFTRKHYPEWNARYPVHMVEYAKAVAYPREKPDVGRFRFSFDDVSGMSDPDCFAEKSAECILKEMENIL